MVFAQTRSENYGCSQELQALIKRNQRTCASCVSPVDIELYQHTNSLTEGKQDPEFEKKTELALKLCRITPLVNVTAWGYRFKPYCSAIATFGISETKSKAIAYGGA
ncbi:MAG: hypothetical protein HWQ40_33165 [Nostoc sp. NMS9]|nr:hypothetical protein [Nostoc sp. NMS9]